MFPYLRDQFKEKNCLSRRPHSSILLPSFTLPAALIHLLRPRHSPLPPPSSTRPATIIHPSRHHVQIKDRVKWAVNE